MSKKKIFNDSDSEGESVHESSDEKEDLLVQSGGSDSDEAPDDVTFADSKKQVLQKVREAVQQIGKEKDKLKQKRRHKEDTYKQQKKQKLEALSKKKLPSEFLESLPSKPITQETPSKPTVNKTPEEATSPQDNLSDASFSDEDLPEDGTESFIPLEEETGIQAVYIKDQLKKPLSSAQAAAEFRNKRLYGSHIRREPMADKMAKKKKKKSRYV